MDNYLNQYFKDGYAILRDVFANFEIEEISNEINRLKEEGMKHPSSYRHGNILYLLNNDPVLGKILRFMHWPSYTSKILDKYRTDQRLMEIIQPIVGNNLKQIGNQIIWKTPEATSTTYSFHQDSQFRRPVSSYRRLGESYIQVSLAIDHHTPESGCVKIVKGSHRNGSINFDFNKSVFKGEYSLSEIERLGYEAKDVIDLVLEPGDLALWSPFTIHGSDSNNTKFDRRSYLNGYVNARNCDIGEWAFKDGKPCKLGAQKMVQYIDIFKRPEPHYIKGTPNPFKKSDLTDNE